MERISNNEAWSNIFDDLRILDRITTDSYFDISADEIKRRDGKEARLSQLSDILGKHKLFLRTYNEHSNSGVQVTL